MPIPKTQMICQDVQKYPHTWAQKHMSMNVLPTQSPKRQLEYSILYSYSLYRDIKKLVCGT